MIKYKLEDLAKDLNMQSKDIAEMIKERFKAVKKPSALLTDEELNYIFEKVTSEKSVSSFDKYFASKQKASAPRQEKTEKNDKKDKSESSRFWYPFGLSAIYRISQSVTSPVTHRYCSKKCWILSKGMISFRSYRSVWTAPGMIISSLFSPFKSLNVSRLR